jgi:alginate O-acetyltransferase complex protein AlgI
MLTMLLGGLWHGASWTFVAWGGLHGAYLAIERWIRERWGAPRFAATLPGRLLLGLGTWALVNVTWVFFRARDFTSAGRFVGSMFGFGAGEKVLSTQLLAQSGGVTVLLLAVHATMRERSIEDVVARAPWWLVGTLWAVMAVLVVTTQGSSDAFIYFQF